ncbi:MAG: mechanosensitive ion channel domain-containing protein [Rhodomicrobiaceae bacterium]
MHSRLNVCFQLLRQFWLAPLLIVALAASASAQIQLSTQAPAQAGTSQLSPSGETAPAANGVPAQPGAAAPPQAEAQKAAPPDFSIVDRATGLETAQQLERWTKQLNDIEQTLNAAYVSYSILGEKRSELDAIRQEIDKFLTVLNPKVEEARAQSDNLGPVPETGEPEPVAAQRAELQKIFGSLSATRNIAESTRLRASQITTNLQELRRKKFTERLFERVPEAYSAYTWQNAPDQFSFAFWKVWQTVTTWWEHLDRKSDAIQLLILGALIGLGTVFLSRRGIRRFRRWKEPGAPPYWLRSTSAAWVVLLRTLPFAATGGFLYATFHSQNLMPENVDLLAYSAVRSLLIVGAVWALIATALATRHPHWRLIPVGDRSASIIRWLVLTLAVLYSFSLFLDTVRYVVNAAFTLTVTQSILTSIAIAGLVIAILLTPRDAATGPEDDSPGFEWLAKLRWPLWVTAAVIMLTALSGYIGLARFISAQLIITGTILSVLYLLMIWVEAVGDSMISEDASLGKWLKEKADLDQRRREQLSVPVTLVLKSLALLLSVPLVLLQWGFDSKDITQWGERLLFGFQIGETTISLAAILASIIVFVVGYMFARFFQGWLDRRVLETAGISGGARHSIRTAVGYAGIVVAALIAISYAGLDLSNIALVAGALSVGIGLGLQGVVNNFVSGLILLAERPIKVGDWVVVGDEQGIVKKISVRATEIETFDRANVLIPNASFISSNVKNWTLHNYSGRISIMVGVHYSSDARQVHNLLLEVAKANPMVMTNPEPFVYFNDFASDALSFTLYAYTYDITKSLGLRTELRIEILEAFRKSGIEIPYRQTDIHFKNLEVMKDLLPQQLTPIQQPPAPDPADQPAPPREQPAPQGRKRARHRDAGNGGNATRTPNGAVERNS